MATVFFLFVIGFAPGIIGPTSIEFLQLFLLIIFILTFIIPLISITMLKLTKAIQSFNMPTREERILPFAMITIYYGVSGYLVVDKLPVNDIVSLILYTITGLILLLTLITFFWKISAHSMAVGGVLGLLCAINLALPESELLIPIIFIAFLSGLIMSARLYLNSHNPPQVYWGAFLGFFLSFSSILILG
ncbi:MAG: phosphatase PAP2 family protein [Candidatus Cyclobacteriaceae bacterium M2_1C_046]